MKCVNCGEEIEDDASYCKHCGSNISWNDKDSPMIEVYSKFSLRGFKILFKNNKLFKISILLVLIVCLILVGFGVNYYLSYTDSVTYANYPNINHNVIDSFNKHDLNKDGRITTAEYYITTSEDSYYACDNYYHRTIFGDYAMNIMDYNKTYHYELEYPK